MHFNDWPLMTGEFCFPSTSMFPEAKDGLGETKLTVSLEASLKCLLCNTEISATELTWYYIKSQISFRLLIQTQGCCRE